MFKLSVNLQPKRQFAADCQVVAQTPICILKAFSQPKRISAAQTHASKRWCPPTPQGLLSGKHAMRGPVKSEGPVGRDAIELRPRKNRRACCRGSIRLATRKLRRACSQGRNRVAAPQTPGVPANRQFGLYRAAPRMLP